MNSLCRLTLKQRKVGTKHGRVLESDLLNRSIEQKYKVLTSCDKLFQPVKLGCMSKEGIRLGLGLPNCTLSQSLNPWFCIIPFFPETLKISDNKVTLNMRTTIKNETFLLQTVKYEQEGYQQTYTIQTMTMKTKCPSNYKYFCHLKFTLLIQNNMHNLFLFYSGLECIFNSTKHFVHCLEKNRDNHTDTKIHIVVQSNSYCHNIQDLLRIFPPCIWFFVVFRLSETHQLR